MPPFFLEPPIPAGPRARDLRKEIRLSGAREPFLTTGLRYAQDKVSG